MNQIIYTSLFETKGMEYLIVIGFLLILVPFWIYISHSKKIVQTVNQAIDTLTQRILNLPKGIYFSKNHTWAYLEKSGTAKIGLNDFLASIVGKVRINLAKNPGETIEKGEILAEVQQGDKKLLILSPVSGTINNLNDAIRENPGEARSNIYHSGWLCEIMPSQWKADTNSFLLAENATGWLLDEVSRFKDFLAVAMVRNNAEPELIALQEGGEIRDQIMADLDGEIWKEFQKSFLD